MRRRVKKLLAIIMSCIFCVQMLPLQTCAETVIDTTVLLTEDNDTLYTINSDGTLQLAEGLTVNGDVQFSGYGVSKLIVPSTATLNGEISGFNTNVIVQNSGTIASDIDLYSGTLENSGYVSNVVVSSGGMLKMFDGASFGQLDMSTAESGMVMTEGTCVVDTLKVNPYGFSVLDSSNTQLNVSDTVDFTGNTELDEKFKIAVSDTTAISTEGQSGLYVWKDGKKYALPSSVMTGETLSDIYSLSIDKNTLSFDEQAIGYQTSEKETFRVTNRGAFDAQLKFVLGGEWDAMFTVRPIENTSVDGGYYYIEPGKTGIFEVELKKALSLATHRGTLTVNCYTPDGDIFETFEISSEVVVAKKPSLAAPSGDFYTLSGTAGENAYYTSDVTVTPMEGYLIAETLEDTFAESITYTESTANPAVYLQNVETEQITEKATLAEIKIDKTKPEVNGCEDAQTYYADSMSVTVTDDNLSSVTLNGEALEIQGQTATKTITAGDDKAEYTLVAEDLAGHSKTVVFTLAPAWKASIDTTTLVYDELAIGYQTIESKTFKITNDSGSAVNLKFASGSEWNAMFKVTASGEAVTDASTVSVAAGDTALFEVTLKKDLSAATHSGTFTVSCYTTDGTVFETFEISGEVVVAKKPSLEAPTGDFYTLSGTAGENDYYTSDVTVTPMEGYLIAETLEDTFADSITYTESTAGQTVYLQKADTKQITEKVTLAEIKIDKTEPVISGVKAGNTYYKDSVSITVTDDNLNSVKLNGTALTVKNKKTTTTITTGDDITEYTVKAVDLAGNSKKVTFYLAPTWREDGTVPSGKSIKLYKNKKYKFSSGTWTVDGDTTNYAGGNAFYVAEDGTYTFGTAN